MRARWRHGYRNYREVGIVNSDYNILANTPLAQQIHHNFTEIGGLTYSPDEQEFANGMMRALLAGLAAKLGCERMVQPIDLPDSFGGASTDVGDVSWVVPAIGITTATRVPGTLAHSQAVASSGMSIGQDGMILAAKVLAATAQDLLTNEALRQQAKSDFEKQLGRANDES